MIPSFTIGKMASFDLRNNGRAADEWLNRNTPDPGNAEYFDWQPDLSGADLDLLLQWESRELHRLDMASPDPEEFENQAALVDNTAADDWDLTGLAQRVDLGVVSCVAALNFLGVPTTSSCRGHYGSSVGREVPYVRFVGDHITNETWGLISSLGDRHGCQLVGCGGGLVELIAGSCADLLAFAASVREQRPD